MSLNSRLVRSDLIDKSVIDYNSVLKCHTFMGIDRWTHMILKVDFFYCVSVPFRMKLKLSLSVKRNLKFLAQNVRIIEQGLTSVSIDDLI